jgi:FtsP/CotA-like multicopper oxidase with cupredoxin domain
MDVTNNLNESTTLHWHGMHLPAIMDGGPHQNPGGNTLATVLDNQKPSSNFMVSSTFARNYTRTTN